MAASIEPVLHPNIGKAGDRTRRVEVLNAHFASFRRKNNEKTTSKKKKKKFFF